ncbi:MAG TPA: PhzF family phenazine biosynthesis protein [Flavisolibacter sp.]|nr:PhzF family phenazine biosynthesis protein [Flavisolibacter sp.]
MYLLRPLVVTLSKGYSVFSMQTNNKGRDANTRMFAPGYGIEEEPGTGMAGPLACYLYDRPGLQKDPISIQQGWFMNPPLPSLTIVDLALHNGKKILKLWPAEKEYL